MKKLVDEHMKKLAGLKVPPGPCSYKISDVHTGAWRKNRPVVDPACCIRCGVCVDLCPCGVIAPGEAAVDIDLTYCKGCGICAEECPKGAIVMRPESDFEGGARHG